MPEFVFPPNPLVALPIVGLDQRFPVRRVYCVGRNYGAHAIEMGHDPHKEPPFFFQKNPDNLNLTGEFPYPSQSGDVHHEVELLVALGRGGSDIPADTAQDCVWGYGVALDMTRRDLQGQAKAAGRPWEIGKAFEHSAPAGPISPVSLVGNLAHAGLELRVNGELRQTGRVDQMIWSVPAIIAALSRYFTLASGDVILTGTPAGVGAVRRGDLVEARIDGLSGLTVRVV